MTPVSPTPGNLRHFRRETFRHSPLLAHYELTRAVGQPGLRTPSEATPTPHQEELTSERSRQLIGEIRTFPSPPMLVFVGGDPFRRPDLPDLVQYSTRNGLPTGLRLVATSLVTRSALVDLHERGLGRVGIALDGATAEVHDAIHGVSGSHARTLQIIRWLTDLGLSVQINTTLSKTNLHQLDGLADLLARLGIDTWLVYFMVPNDPALIAQRIPAERIEEVFG